MAELVVTSSAIELKSILDRFSSIVSKNARTLTPVAPAISRRLQAAADRAKLRADLAMQHEPILEMLDNKEKKKWQEELIESP